MEHKNLNIMENLLNWKEGDDLPGLDTAVLGALELYVKNGLPELSLDVNQDTLIIGSSNAEVTGKIMFSRKGCFIANESSYQDIIFSRKVFNVVVLSAFGGKHATIITKNLKELGKNTYLLTCNPSPPSADYVKKENIVVFPRIPEPYTYNVSTYMGMILSSTKEDPKKILEFIQDKVDPFLDGIGEYPGYFFIIPSRFDFLREMFTKKFVELFGRRVSKDVYTDEQSKHAATIVPSDELFIVFGKSTFQPEGNVLNIPLPEWADYGTMMCVGYYVIGKIQEQKPSWFKDNIVGYCKKAREMFGENIEPIVK